MIKVKVISRFKDQFNGSMIYEVGQIVEFADKDRVKNLTERNLIEVISGSKIDALAAARAAKSTKASELDRDVANQEDPNESE